ncbi:helix-turn-helix transcriptional regulator [Trebonia sp.]|uniref:helix-turn-helix domain-containing protein n=1 Tax=Trebonia sp. TaxID=2767075 RepID=UPI002639FD08|nr:helix-turn-helix transcriptional regulator [Trebonia sp.]
MANAEGDSQQQAPSVRSARGSSKQAVLGANPTVRQRELGIRLRELRNSVALTVEEAGTRMGCSAAKISRMETGARRASLRDVRELCAIYGITDAERVEELVALAGQAREPGWWSQYDEPLLSPYLGLEQEAAAITAYSMYVVPALLQTAEYARATIKSVERRIDPAVLDQRVEARLRRQELFARRTPPRYRALLDEAILRRPVGGAQVMGAQLGKILELAAAEKAAIQVIPFDVGVYASADSNFVLLEFGSGSPQPPVVFVEGLFSNRYQERRAEIERYREAIEYLRDAALSPRDSLSLIGEIKSMQQSHKSE